MTQFHFNGRLRSPLAANVNMGLDNETFPNISVSSANFPQINVSTIKDIDSVVGEPIQGLFKSANNDPWKEPHLERHFN